MRKFGLTFVMVMAFTTMTFASEATTLCAQVGACNADISTLCAQVGACK